MSNLLSTELRIRALPDRWARSSHLLAAADQISIWRRPGVLLVGNMARLLRDGGRSVQGFVHVVRRTTTVRRLVRLVDFNARWVGINHGRQGTLGKEQADGRRVDSEEQRHGGNRARNVGDKNMMGFLRRRSEGDLY